jgi:hypothetical protein
MGWLLRHRRTKVAATDRPIPNDVGACPLLYPELSGTMNNTSVPDSALVGEMLFYNPDNISFPYHLQQKKNGAWNKTTRIKNPESLQVGQNLEQKIEYRVGQFFE